MSEHLLIPMLAGLLLAVGKESIAGRGGTPMHFIENFWIGVLAAWLTGFLWALFARSGASTWPGRSAMELQFLATLLFFATNLIPANGQGVLYLFDDYLYSRTNLFRDSVWLLDVARVLFCSLIARFALQVLGTAAFRTAEEFTGGTSNIVLAVKPGVLATLVGATVAYICIYCL